MIHYLRDGKQVRATIKYKSGDLDTNLFFYWECGSEVLAQALATQLQANQWDSVEKALREMYEQGYKDGRDKKAKKTWFSQVIKHINA